MDLTKRFIAAIAGTALLLAGCVTGGETASGVSTAAPENSCNNLVESRRKLAVEIDDLESGRSSPGTWKSVLFAVGALNVPYSQQPVLRDAQERERAKVLGEMRARRVELSQQIEQKQCTAEGRGKAGSISTTDTVQEDGDYSGKGQTDSWCSAPLLRLQVRSGRVTGSLRSDSKASESYEVSGQLYDDGTLSLKFKRPQSEEYAEDFEGLLKYGILSFTAQLDHSAKGCLYRFAVKRRSSAQPNLSAMRAPNGATAAASTITSATPSTPFGPGNWMCLVDNFGNSSNPRFTLQIKVGADNSIVVVSYGNAPATVLQKDPLTFTAVNPRGSRPTQFIWKANNVLTITGPNLNDPGQSFYNEGACTKTL